MFLMLVYMSLNQMEIDTENIDEMLLNGMETCKSSKHTQAEPLVNTIIDIFRHGNVKDVHSLMAWEFVDKMHETSKYRLQHNVIKRMTLIVFGNFHFDKLLEMTKRGDLEGWIERNNIVKTVKKAVDDMMPILIIDGKK